MKAIFIVVLALYWYNYNFTEKEIPYVKSESGVLSDSLFIPKIDSNDVIVEHFAYKLVYSEAHEQAKWVFYKLTKDNLNGISVDRTNRFKQDPLIATESASGNDYRGSGYDRGHLAPAADMAWSKLAMDESFYYSNMSPQSPSFNRGIWKKLESQVRNWALLYDSIYVITGPVLDSGLVSIGSNVSIPKCYYKSVLKYSGDIPSVMAFLLPNEGSKLPLQNFTLSVDSLEQISGLDFYSSMGDTLQKSLEGSVCLNCWEWK
jgi:endonuclease G